jgi:uncharacterized membrane protein YcgQ (UPF0703/DUF1980 family)
MKIMQIHKSWPIGIQTKIVYYYRMRSTLLFALIFLLPCHAQKDRAVCSIKDRLFLQQVQDIYLNPDSYRGKTIQIEGFFGKFTDEKNKEFYVVFRNSAGCCGNDGKSGFEFVYKKGKLDFKDNEWIYVEAKLAEDGERIYLDATSVTKKQQGKSKGFVM